MSAQLTEPAPLPEVVLVSDEVRRKDIQELADFVQSSLEATAKKHGLPVSFDHSSEAQSRQYWRYFFARLGHCDIDVNIQAYQEFRKPDGPTYICSAYIEFTGLGTPFHDYGAASWDSCSDEKTRIEKRNPCTGDKSCDRDKEIFLEVLDLCAAQIKIAEASLAKTEVTTKLSGGTSELLDAYTRARGITSREQGINTLLREAMHEKPSELHQKARSVALAALNQK